MSTDFLSAGITVRLGNQEYGNHSVVFVGDIKGDSLLTQSHVAVSYSYSDPTLTLTPNPLPLGTG